MAIIIFMLCINFKILDLNSFKITDYLGNELILSFIEYKIKFLGLLPKIEGFHKYSKDQILELTKSGEFDSFDKNQPYVWLEKL